MMKAKLIFLLKYYLFWVVISIVAKIMFLFYQWSDTTHLSAADFWHILAGGIRLDLSLSGYILMLSSVILICSVFVGEKIIRAVFAGLTLSLLLFFWGVVVVDLELFKNWGFHIDTTPLMYLKTPKEAMASTPLWLNLCLTLLMLGCVVLSFWVFRRYVLKGLRYKRGNYWGIPVFLLIGGAMILPVRGGVNLAPLNSSAVFYHAENMYANQAAVNAVWNFIYELMHMKNLDKKYNYLPEQEVAQVVDSLMHTGTDYPRLLKTERPNIVFLLLESFTANAVEVLGGIPGVTPNLNQLAKEGQLVKGNSRIIEITGKGDSKKSGSSESILKALGKKAESAEEGVASASGYVSYYIDGSEGKLTTSRADKITEKYLDKYGDTSVKKFGTGSVAKGEPVFKIVTNGDWLVIFFVDKDQKNHYTEGSSVTMKFPDESNDVTGTVRSVTKDGSKYRVAIDSNMMFKSMLSKRKLSVSVTSASADAIVVKCSSIVKKNGQTGVIVKNQVGKLIFKPVMIKADNGEEAAVYQDLYMDSDGNFHKTMTVYDEVLKNPGKNEIKEASVLK